MKASCQNCLLEPGPVKLLLRAAFWSPAYEALFSEPLSGWGLACSGQTGGAGLTEWTATTGRAEQGGRDGTHGLGDGGGRNEFGLAGCSG